MPSKWCSASQTTSMPSSSQSCASRSVSAMTWWSRLGSLAPGNGNLPNFTEISARGPVRERASPEVLRPAVGARLLPGATPRRVEPDQRDGIAHADLAAREHARVHATLSRVTRLAHALDVSVEEPAGVLPAG